MNLTEKHKAFHTAHNECVGIENQIAELEETIDGLRKQLATAESERDAKASEAAEEKLAAGFAGIEMPDGTFRLVQRARRGKKTDLHPDGIAPKYPFVVSDKVLRT